MPRPKKHLTPERARLAELHVYVADTVVHVLIRRKHVLLYRWPGLEKDDMHGVAYEALCHAAIDWNVGGGDFSSFAFQRCWYRVIDWLRTAGPIKRSGKRRPREVAWIEEGFGTDGDFLDRGPPTEMILHERLEDDFADVLIGRQFVNHCFEKLNPREAHVLRATLVDGRTLDSVAREMGVTESRISQIRTRALNKLRRDPDVVYAVV